MAFNLEKVQFVLEKRKINNIPCNVVFGIDGSGSMDGLYYNGTVQTVTDRIFTISMSVDVDKILDMYVFGGKAVKLNAVTEKNINGYINKNIKLNWSSPWDSGDTNYAPVIEAICDTVKPKAIAKVGGFFSNLFGGKKDDNSTDGNIPPVLAIIITDGSNNDRDRTRKILDEAKNLNIYWQLVGIGSLHFDFLKELGDAYPNVGYVSIPNITKKSEEELYDELLNDEFAEWVKRFK